MSGIQLIGMHGWAGDHRGWAPWSRAAAARGWSFCCGERGYGQEAPQQPSWASGSERRVVIGHSFGPHLLGEALWREATAAVLLASFTRFVPEGREGRAVNAALRAMGRRIRAGEEQEQLRDFLQQAASPQSRALLPEGPLEQGIGPDGRKRLLEDLEQLGSTSGLPAGFPSGIPVLIVEGGQDQIVSASSREELKQALPEATVWSRNALGHSLIDPALPDAVLDWIADAQA